jgi:hypothetical protein
LQWTSVFERPQGRNDELLKLVTNADFFGIFSLLNNLRNGSFEFGIKGGQLAGDGSEKKTRIGALRF